MSFYSAQLLLNGVANDGNWHHVAFTYDGTTMTMYLDGSDEGSMTATYNDASAFALVFGGRGNGDRTSNMAVDDIQFFDNVLSASEILAIAIPEPATSGLVVAFGGGLFAIRRLKPGSPNRSVECRYQPMDLWAGSRC